MSSIFIDTFQLFISSVISFESIRDKTLFPDLPPGPLERYRNNAKFDYRKLALMLDGEKCLRFRVGFIHFLHIYNILTPESHHSPNRMTCGSF